MNFHSHANRPRMAQLKSQSVDKSAI